MTKYFAVNGIQIKNRYKIKDKNFRLWYMSNGHTLKLELIKSVYTTKIIFD